MQVLRELPPAVDCERWFHQELVGGDGAVCKVYCIAEQAFLVEELAADAARLDSARARRRAVAMDPGLAETAVRVGRMTGLEVYAWTSSARPMAGC